MTLIEFLLERIAEDEHDARVAAEASDRYWALNVDPRDVWVSDFDNGTPLLYGTAVRGDKDGWRKDERLLTHVARHEPHRVLADCETWKALVEIHGTYHECSTGRLHGIGVESEVDESDALCPTIRILGLPYDRHPDYRTDWRP